jgi:DNA (cytosine-5)-methyltransferase 1
MAKNVTLNANSSEGKRQLHLADFCEAASDTSPACELNGAENLTKVSGFDTVDLFSGCGGMSLGFQNAGFNIIAAYDNWEPAVLVYRKNFKHPIYKEDLRNQEVKTVIEKLKPDVIIGGPPCQDFSSAGHRNEKLGRADLTVVFSEIVIESKPRYFVMENVPRIQKSNVLKHAIALFKKAGYGLTAQVLDASYCGVPQSRKRYFLVGHQNSPDGFLTRFLHANIAESPMSIHDYLGDSLGVECYFRIPRSYNRRAIFSIYEPCVTIRAVDRPIPRDYKKHPGDLVEIGPEVRALTVIERSYMQTFPKTFIFEDNKTNLNQMIGNAVPVKLAEFVGRAIQDHAKSMRSKVAGKSKP